jgi:hypothetical protein
MTRAPNPAAQAAMLFQKGDIASARQVAEAALADGEEFSLLHIAGVACCRQGDLAGGIDYLQRAATLRPAEPAVLVTLMRALIDADRAAEALELPFGGDNLPPAALLLLWRTRAEAAHRAGNAREEAEALERVLLLDEGNQPAREKIISLLFSLDQSRRALFHLDQLPPSPNRDRARASAMLLDRRIEEGAAINRELLQSDSSDRSSWLSLVDLAERQNDAPELERLIAHGEMARFDERELDYPRALIAKRKGDTNRALELAEASIIPADPARRASLVATLADRAGDAQRAFVAATEASMSVEDRDGWRRRAADHRAKMQAIEAALTDDWVAAWTEGSPSSRRSPVFLVAFPRSGTTLLDTFLRGHPDVEVVEEEPMLDAATRELGDLENLNRESPERIDRARQAYFEELSRHVPDGGDKLVVDKLPLAMTGAPVIHRLFPDAKFIFARRHPADAVLSNYLQSFQLNDAMANFLDIGDAAAFYDVALSLWFRARRKLKLDVYDIAYEDLVADTEGTLRPLVDWLGLSWQPELLDHRRTAARRDLIATPSYDQVMQPIHQRASGRWKRYADQLAPVLPTLDSWARQLGYGSTGKG